MRVVVSIGGSVLAPDLDARRVEGHAAVVETLAEEGCEIGAVVGGGGVARDYIGAARELGANEVQLDQIGIDVTRINARLLIAALGPSVDPKVAHDYEDAGDAIRRGDVSVMGGVMPGQTTDAVAAALAEYVGADLLVYATSVDGVYSADPSADDDAEKYEQLTGGDLVDVIAPMSRDAGASAPVDLLAAKLIERAEMRTIVLDGTDPSRIEDAVLRGEHTGTDIVPTGVEDEPSYWTQR
ncbi:UMP kinase [Halobellus sp. Atlit-38R]|uniref:UMP kinase n=1 Tax=Halobellus sp. Atlit-38R TaxID=2282131 RepID=UPI000EF243F8|nr:UMP kinase [Halobellus sp. Atlit-38R]RLM90385.1 UMP kinase [Halobellus sp. Atlit-38R]